MTDAATTTPATPTHIPIPAYTGPERRSEMRLWREHVDKRLDDGSANMKAMREELAANTKATKEVQSDTGELVELLKSFKGAFVVFDMLGKFAKPAAAITALIVAAWSFVSTVKGGK